MNHLELADLPMRELAPGCPARIVHSQFMTFVHWYFRAGSVIPGHARRIGPGAVVVIPPNAPHSAKALTPCYVIDAFYPIREDYR